MKPIHPSVLAYKMYHKVTCKYCDTIEKDAIMTRVHDFYVCTSCERKLLPMIDKLKENGGTFKPGGYISEEDYSSVGEIHAEYTKKCKDCKSHFVAYIYEETEVDYEFVTHSGHVYCYACGTLYYHEFIESITEDQHG